jgi:hypothetical protein
LVPSTTFPIWLNSCGAKPTAMAEAVLRLP